MKKQELYPDLTAHYMDTIQYEVPFYTYEEYEENYDKELKSFLDKYPSSSESDYKEYIGVLYKSWIDDDQTLLDYTIIEKQNTFGGYDEFQIGFSQFVSIVDSYFKKLAPKAQFSKETFEKVIDRAKEEITAGIIPNDTLSIECTKYFLQKKYHLKFYRFLYRDESGEIVFNIDKYRDFNFAIKRILNDIKTEKTTKQEVEEEIIDEDFDTSTKQRLIILHQLGIVDYIKSIQTDSRNVAHTAKILASILNEKGNTIKSYLNPMLTEDEQLGFTKNNPYYVERNKAEAKRIIDKLYINTSKIKQ